MYKKYLLVVMFILLGTVNSFAALNANFDSVVAGGTNVTVGICPGATGIVYSPNLTVLIEMDRDILASTVTTDGIRLQKVGTVSSVAASSASLLADKRTVSYVFPASNGIESDTNYQMLIKKNSIKVDSSPDYSLVTSSDYKTATCFKTASVVIPPTVVSVSPADNATGAGLNTTVDIKFSEALDATTVSSSNIYISGVAGAVAYSAASNTATITPSALLSYNTLYTVNVSTNIKNASGTNLANAFSSTYRTLLSDTTAPQVLNIQPANNATGIDINSSIVAQFDEAIAPTSLTTSTMYVTTAAGASVSGTVSYDTVAMTGIFTPTSTLAINTEYRVYLTNGVKDLANNGLTAFSSKFTTKGLLTLYPSDLNNYCQIPPFVTTGASGLKPNVLIVLDNSGSMGEFAYKSDNKGTSTSNKDDSYNPNTSYYGYFTSDKMYKYTTSGGYFEIDGTKTYDATDFWSGNMLNWLTMRRVDVVRRVLVGGKTIPRSANTANYLLIDPNSDNRSDKYKTYNSKYYVADDKLYVCANTNCYTTGYTAEYNLKVYVGDQDPQVGLLLQNKDKINFGVMKFQYGNKFEDSDNTADGGDLVHRLDGTGQDLITKVEGADPETWTPLAESFYDGVHYFMAKTSPYGNGNYAASDPITASCQKNFMLVLTDGESTKDRNLPGGSWGTPVASTTNSGSLNVATMLSKIATNEGTASRDWTSGTTSGGSWYLPAVAYWAHITDLRSTTVGKSNFVGTQNISSYFVYAFDNSANARELLKLAAKYGGFEESTFTSASVPDSDAKWDANGDGVPDNYFEASQGQELESSLKKAFEDILSKVSSGTSASIVNNRGESGANLFQAVFYPKRTQGSAELYWYGELQNMWYYLDPLISTSSIREDTDTNKYLDLKADYKVTLDYDTSKNQTVANWYQDTTGLGSFTSLGSGSPDNVKALWRAGGMLHRRSPVTRKIYSVTGSYNANYLTNNGLTLFDYTDNTIANNLGQYMNVSDIATAKKVMQYIRGEDFPGDTAYRNRTTTMVWPSTNPSPLNTSITGTWKLGDVVSSTPQAQTSKQLHAFDVAYKDTTYSKFYNSTDYKARNMVYTAANDGMLHAFRIGAVARTAYDPTKPNLIAKLSNTPLSNSDTLLPGDEMWAFIPQNTLPYLKYYGDASYNHLYYVNNTVTLVDASINRPASDSSCASQDEYWKCNKKTSYLTSGDTMALNTSETSWRTILLGGMGLGGASRDYSGFCNKDDGTTPTTSAQETRTDCVKSPMPGIGLSSFYALDITNPNSPQFMWEFSDAILPAADKGLGYSISGPAIVRINTKNPSTADHGTADVSKNGRWFAVFATGPTGPIDLTNHQFLAKSDSKLKVYVVDLHPKMSGGWVKGTNYWVFDSGILNGFAGDLSDVVVDVDRWNSNSPSYYSDDAVYIGFTKENTSTGTWTDGGILRLLTNNSINPAEWNLSTMLDGIGPVTSSPTKLQDRKNGKLWIFAGTGRFFYKDTAGVDDPDTQRHIFGVQDVCYDSSLNTMNTGWTAGGAKYGCASANAPTLTLSDMQDQSSTILTTLPAAKKGWYIELDPSGTYSLGSQMTSSDYNAERVVTNTISNFNGTVYFTTFLPSSDTCSYGGSTLEWIVDYNTGGVPPASAMKGKLMIQLSGGEFITLDLSTATKGTDAADNTRGDRRIKASLAGHGIAGSKGGSLQSASQPIRKILHIMEK